MITRLPKGHTHEDIDSMFGVIWTRFRDMHIDSPAQAKVQHCAYYVLIPLNIILFGCRPYLRRRINIIHKPQPRSTMFLHFQILASTLMVASILRDTLKKSGRSCSLQWKQFLSIKCLFTGSAHHIPYIRRKVWLKL